MVYDWLLCWEHEAELLKIRGIPPTKFAYVFCRYWPLLTYPLILWEQVAVSDRAECARIFQLPLFLVIVNFAAAASVLIVRVYAFTGSRITVAVGLTCAFLAAGAYQVWAVATQIMLATPAPACFARVKHRSSKALSLYFFAPFLFDLVATSVFILCAARIRFGTAGSSTAVAVFIREGIAYFLAISVINLGNAAMSFQTRVNISGTVVPFSMLLPNILACRLVINLRSSASKPIQGLTNMSSDIEFGPRCSQHPFGDEAGSETVPLSLLNAGPGIGTTV
ncbi:hypothetical protein AURDEDRAFT_182963 [Auricularia subglabra TFB-10046 SS5]|nr:hypothetical protein AURDEDRAFT_182963 [Auricularia subglabra TFB-10046 SS5]